MRRTTKHPALAAPYGGTTTASTLGENMTAIEVLARMTEGLAKLREVESAYDSSIRFGLGGLKIAQSPLCEIPKVRGLSSACPCSAPVREEFNAWLLKMFGTRDAEAYVFGNTVFCGPKTMAKLKGLGDA